MKNAVAIWICCCAYLNCVGWILSAMHELNSAGSAVALLFGFTALAIWRKQTSEKFLPRIHWQKNFRRFKKIFPLAFLIVTTLEFIGGAIYPPNNYDALTYRLPRMLNWLSASHWFWIPTVNERMNFSGTAWEWIGMPFFALLRSDRALFLIEFVSFLLMPGMLFFIFRQLGAARKVAWTWMWIVPLAYGYALQAGGVGNDLIGAVFALAAMFCGLRARVSGKISDVWFTGLAAALLTSAKLSNLPLLLPCLVAVWPALARLKKRWPTSFIIACATILASNAPMMMLNQIHTSSWTGDPKNTTQVAIKNPAAAFLGNSLLLAQQSFMPPLLPQAHKANEWFEKQLPASARQFLEKNFPRYCGTFNELPQEEASGVGLGITLLLLTGIVAAIFQHRKKFPALAPQIWAVHATAWAAAIFFMLKMGSEADPRLMLPYYPFVIAAFLLLPSQPWLLQFRLWKIFAVIMTLSVLPAVILSPSRPLWPASRVSEWLEQHYPQSAMVSRMTTVYSTYAHRNDLFASLRSKIPDGTRKIGFIAENNDSDYSFWRPFGQRQVVYLQNEIQTNADLPDNVQWIVVKQAAWPKYSSVPLEQWTAQHHAQIIASISVTTLVGAGPEIWHLLRIENK